MMGGGTGIVQNKGLAEVERISETIDAGVVQKVLGSSALAAGEDETGVGGARPGRRGRTLVQLYQNQPLLYSCLSNVIPVISIAQYSGI